jgi:branched-chain amino acid transport system ATP-binding protein
VDAAYGQIQVLFGVSMAVDAGEMVALLGTNGAGKSTVLRVIAGLMTPVRGRVWFDGTDITRLGPIERVKLGLVTVPGGRGVFGSLTVEENLRLAGWLTKKDRDFIAQARRRIFELFPVLAERSLTPAASLSGGEQQMLTIARTLMGNPRCVLLDEPSEGLAPIIVEQMGDSIRALKSEGLSILLSEQNMHFSLGVADRAYIIEKGRIRFAGSMAELAADASLREQYLSV